jgi:hypothetical protein
MTSLMKEAVEVLREQLALRRTIDESRQKLEANLRTMLKEMRAQGLQLPADVERELRRQNI